MKFLQKNSAISLPKEWDDKCENYFQKRKFLAYCERYNPCQQVYYCLFEKNKFVSGCVVYKLKINSLTFIGGSRDLNMTIIGLPISVSCSGIIGKKEILIDQVLKKEKGLILVMNEDQYIFKKKKKTRITSLPTIIFENSFEDTDDYINQMRKSYRRRLRKSQNKKIGLEKDQFTKKHYKYYLQVMNKTKTKLETLSFDFFANLPKEFVLCTAKVEEQIIAWNITLIDKDKLFFFFGGLNYRYNKTYCAYFNNLYEIIYEGIRNKCKIIDLGQTAEIAKIRAGGKPIKKFIYLHHSNLCLNFILKLIKVFFQYKKKIPKIEVFKK